MDYEKKYKDALVKLKEHFTPTSDDIVPDNISREEIENMFPELKESEDELTWLTNYIQEEAYSLSMDIRDNEDRVKLKKLQRSLAWLEKHNEQKEYTFKALPRLLDMIEPTERAKAYCQKLIDSLVKEEYFTDAKIVGECLKKMNGENVPMAIMDEKQEKSKWTEEDDKNLESIDIILFEYKDLPKENYWKMINWLKTIKQRLEE